MDLVIMAAGMGSRFGGLKQIEAMGPNGEFLIDYSIYDAIKYGFDRVVFIIKRENFEIFKRTIGKRVEGKIEVVYVFQEANNIPKNIDFTREKPWGTAHAIYCCKDVVKNNFAIINADDFYGADAYYKASTFLRNNKDFKTFGMIGYKVMNTLTENGAVKRGICQEKNGYLTSLIESNVLKNNGVIEASPLDGTMAFTVSKDTLVSMNMFLFTPYIFEILDKDIKEFFADKTDLEKKEFLIPDVVFNNIKKDNVKVKVLDTDGKWYGVTYKEDKDNVCQKIKELVDTGVYPEKLW